MAINFRALTIVLSCVAIVLGWSLATPIFEFPDEQAHFGTVSFRLAQNHLPRGRELDLTQEMKLSQERLGVFRNPLGQNRYTYHPEFRVEYSDNYRGIYEDEIRAFNTPVNRNTYVGEEAARYPALYYWLTGNFTSLVDSQDLLTRLFVTRLAGLLIAAGLAFVLWHLGLEIFHSRSLAATLCTLVFLQPMFSFVTAGINSDNLHHLWLTALLLFCVRLINHGLNRWDVLGASAVITLDILTKPQGYIAIPLIALALLISAFKRREWRIILVFLLAFAAFLAYFRNYWLDYFVGPNNQGASFVEYLRFSLNKLLAQNVVWYWGVFKWLGVVLPPAYWRVANRVVLVAVLGLGIYWVKVKKKSSIVAPSPIVLFLCLASLEYALAIFWFDWQYLKNVGFSLGIQARYFFPTIAAHLSLLMIGILSFAGSSRVQTWLRRSLIVLFLWLQFGGFWRLLTSYYDTGTIADFITQASQYKPIFVKGSWWYLWVSIYLVGLIGLLRNSLAEDNQPWVGPSQKSSSRKARVRRLPAKSA